jgi:hypothetical protein
VERVEWMFVFKAAAYNLIRLPRLLATGWVCPESTHGRISGLAEPPKRLKIALEIGNPSIIRANSDFEGAFSAAC